MPRCEGRWYLNFIEKRLEIGLSILRVIKSFSNWNPFRKIEFKIKLISTFVSNINDHQHLPKT